MLKVPLDETMARLRCLATAAIVVVTLLGSLLLGILAPRPQRLPRWSDGTAAMAGRVVAEGWRCRAGQPQAACIRKLLRRLRGGRLRPFANRTNVSATSCAPASACAAARARALGRRVDVVAFGGSVTVGHGTGGRSGNRESKFMPYVELFAAALRVTSGSEVRAFNFGVPAAGPQVPSFCFHAMAKAAGAEPSIVILEFSVNGLDRLGFLAAGVRAAYPAAVVVYLDVFSMDELSMPGCRSLDKIPSLAPNDIPGVSLRPGFLPSSDRPGSFKTAGLLYGNRKRATRIHMNVEGHLLATYLLLDFYADLRGSGARRAREFERHTPVG